MAHVSVETVVFAAISVVWLPGSIYCCWRGLHGGLLDTTYHENLLAAFAVLLFGMIPPVLALLSWTCDKRCAEERGFDVRRPRN